MNDPIFSTSETSRLVLQLSKALLQLASAAWKNIPTSHTCIYIKAIPRYWEKVCCPTLKNWIKYELTLQLFWPGEICNSSFIGLADLGLAQGKVGGESPTKYPSAQRFIKRVSHTHNKLEESLRHEWMWSLQCALLSRIPSVSTSLHYSQKIQRSLLSIPNLHHDSELS